MQCFAHPSDNLWHGRQMFPDQKVHRSVQIRLMHDHQHLDAKNKRRYVQPAAKVPVGRASWTQVARGMLHGNEAFWED
jgi:hypothetical protein